MSTSEIAKLESRWRENRQGLSFAPLAEAYRKMGDPARALEVLGEGLAVNPNYIPASIVLGRCHLDLGDDPNAETAFRHVLDLDNENVIALRSLADIAQRGGRIGAARELLQSLLVIDRGNEDARAQLASLELADESAEVADETAVTAGSTDSAEFAEPADGAPADHATVEAGDSLDSAIEAGGTRPEPWDDNAPSADQVAEPSDASPGAPAEAEESFFADAEAAAPDVDDDWVPDPEPFTPEPVERDESIQLQEHLTPQQDVAPLDDLVVDDAPEISDATVEADVMDGLVGQDFAEQGAAVEPLDDLKTGPGSLTDFADLERSTELELTSSDTNEFQVASAADELAADVAESDDTGNDWITSVEPPEDFPSLEVDEHAVMPEENTAPSFETVSGSYGADALGDGIELDAADAADAAGADETDEADATDVAVEAEGAGAADERGGTDWGDDDGIAGDTPELVVTESMADLYLRQGHRKEALAVYRLLYQRAPDDLRLRERVDELETEVAAEVSGAEPVESVISLAAADADRTVSSLFQALLRATLPGPAGDWEQAVAPAPRPLAESQSDGEAETAAPTRPAGDHLSLSDVFGEEGSPVPPAVPASRRSAEGEVSFDAFFGDANGEQPLSRPPAREDDDLDQFHSWLQNLKR